MVGENAARGAFMRSSRMAGMLAADAGLEAVSRHARSLPRRSRYLPPPSERAGARLGGRMRREVVLEMRRRAGAGGQEEMLERRLLACFAVGARGIVRATDARYEL